MNADKAAKLIKRLVISTASLATLSAALLMFIAMRPVEIKEVEINNGPGQIIYDMGNGRKIIAPGDGIVEWEGKFADSVTPAKINRTDAADAVGVSVTSMGSASSLVMELDFGTPEASIPDGGTSATGYANLGVKALFTSGVTPLYVIAAISIIVGFVLWFWLKAAKLGLGFIVGGVTLLAVAHLFTTYPWVLLILLFVALAVVGIIIWDYWKKKKVNSTVGAIIAAGESLPEKMRAIFTSKVGAEAAARGISKTAKSVVTAVKSNGAGVARASSSAVSDSDERALYNELKTKYDTSPAQPQVIVVPAGQPIPAIPPA